jgi:predicted nuclease with TOPRIM domain
VTTSLGQAFDRISSLESENSKLNFICKQLLQNYETQNSQIEILFSENQKLQQILLQMTQIVLNRTENNGDKKEYPTILHTLPEGPPDAKNQAKYLSILLKELTEENDRKIPPKNLG